jgi:hypothetical protein
VCAGGWLRCCLGGGGRLSSVPATFKISYVIWLSVLSNQIVFSYNNPVPRGFFTVMTSPLSYTYNLHFDVYLYTSYLFMYSCRDSDILHLIIPLLRRIPAYNNLLLAFDGQLSTNCYSPGGALTLMQPVVKAKSYPSYLSRAVFHSSRSPLYLLV